LNDLLTQLSQFDPTITGSNDHELVKVLVADFIAVVRSNVTNTDRDHLNEHFGTDLTGMLAILNSRNDLDDVDWQIIHHPGSVIIPAVIAIGLEVKATGKQVIEAMRTGYYSMAMFSSLLTPDMRKKWHATSVAGAIGATQSTSTLLKLTQNERYAALNLACANLGGLALAGSQRNGAAQFNRAAAAVIGVQAARAARQGAPHLPDSYDKLLAAWDLADNAGSATTFESPGDIGLSSASLRLLPFSGFVQAAIFGYYSLLQSRRAVTEIQIFVSAPTFRLTVTSAEETDWVDKLWWNLPAAIAFLESTGDPFAPRSGLIRSKEKPNVTFLENKDLGVHQAILRTIDVDGAEREDLYTAPGLDPLDTESRQLWERKCSDYLKVSATATMELATTVTSGGLRALTVQNLFLD
jgi:hypothetical protein